MLAVLPDIVLNALHVSHFILTTIWFDVIFLLQLRKLSHREVKSIHSFYSVTTL